MNKIKNKSLLMSFNTLQYLIGLSIGVLIVFVLMLIFAFVVSSFDVPEIMVEVFGLLSLSVGAMLSSMFLGFKFKKGGLILGTINGFSILFLIFIIGLIVKGTTFNAMFFVKLLFVILSSLIGGIYAVNKVAKRRI